MRWLELLEQYKFKILYTPRKNNGRADALNRRLDYIVIREVSQELILKIEDDGSLIPLK